MENEKLKQIIFRAQKDFVEEFKNIIPCSKSNEHDWSIDLLFEPSHIRFIDIECKNCKTNLAIALRFFSGIQDHG